MSVDYDAYALRRDALIISKFVTRCMKWEEDYILYKQSNGTFPKPVGKNTKWPAYEAASRIERTLKLDTHASGVPALAALVGVVFAHVNNI